MLQRLIELVKPDASLDIKLSGVALYIGKVLDKYDTRLNKLELRQLQKGDKGDKGDSGKDGKPGVNGKDGIDGKDGVNGKDGKNGAKGKDGVSVVDAEIAADGHFVFKLSDGKEIDVVSPIGFGKGSIQVNTQLANYQITVSATPPISPQVNDLWLQT